MALTAYFGNYTSPTSTGNVNYTASGTPKALFLFGLAANAGWQASTRGGIGASDFTNDRSLSLMTRDNAAASEWFTRGRDAAHSRMGSTSAIVSVATATSPTTDQFTLNYTTASFAYNGHYLALAGDDIDNVLVGGFACPTSTGDQTLTLGFQADVVFFFSYTPTAFWTSDTGYTSACFGVMTPTDEWCMGWAADHGADPTETERVMDAANGIHATDDALGTLFKASYVSRTSTEWTINWSVVPGTARYISYLAIGGGQWKVGTFAKSTSGAPADQTVSGIGFTPVAALFGHVCGTNSDGTVQDEAKPSMGGADGTREGATLYELDDNLASSDDNSLDSTTKAIVHATAGTSTTAAEADMTGFGSGTIGLTWTTNDGNAVVIGYIAVGEAAGGIVTGAAALSGVGTMSAGLAQAVAGAAALSAQGAAQVGAAYLRAGAAALAGSGDLAAGAAEVAGGAAGLSGEGLLDQGAARLLSAAAALGGVVTLDQGAAVMVAGGSALSGVLNIEATGNLIGFVIGAAQFQAVSALASQGASVLSGMAQAEVESLLAAGAAYVRSGANPLSGLTTLNAGDVIILAGGATLTGRLTLTGSGTVLGDTVYLPPLTVLVVHRRSLQVAVAHRPLHQVGVKHRRRQTVGVVVEPPG